MLALLVSRHMLSPLTRTYRDGQVTKLVMVACCLLPVDIGTMSLGGQYVECWPSGTTVSATHLLWKLEDSDSGGDGGSYGSKAGPDGECCGRAWDDY